MWSSRTPFLSFGFRHRLLISFLLSVSLPVAAQPTPPPQAPFLTGLISLLKPLANTWSEIGGVSLFLGVLALFWWVYQLKKQLKYLNRVNISNSSNNINKNLDPESLEFRILKLEEFAHDFMKNIKKINSDLIEIGLQGREALILAKTVDSIQRRQPKISNLDTQGYKTSEAILPNLLNNLQDDLVEPNESKSVAHYSVDISAADPAKAIAVKYQDAVSRDDRSALRQMVSGEMSITEDCEQALLRGTASATTQLQIDQQGGSYLLIRQDNKNWLVPTFLTLKSFTTIQPAKGLFFYERDNVSIAELRRPAEVTEERGVWEVVNMGVVAVPA
jgi:hypothetical protein